MDIIFLIIIIIIGGVLLGVKTMRDRERGKIDTLKHVPYVGRLSLVELWWPKNNHEKNIILGKLLIMFYMIFAIMLDGYYRILFLVITLLPVVFYLDFLPEDGCN